MRASILFLIAGIFALTSSAEDISEHLKREAARKTVDAIANWVSGQLQDLDSKPFTMKEARLGRHSSNGEDFFVLNAASLRNTTTSTLTELNLNLWACDGPFLGGTMTGTKIASQKLNGEIAASSTIEQFTQLIPLKLDDSTAKALKAKPSFIVITVTGHVGSVNRFLANPPSPEILGWLNFQHFDFGTDNWIKVTR
jgi:hypothetical protein